MTHVTPFIVQAGRAVQGSSLGYHAYSLRIDNLSNQWYQEASTLVWVPPYSLGVVLRLWGTSVALLQPAAPTGQAQLAPIGGEYAVAVYSDEFRAENPGVPVRQFTLVQAVSDLTEGPQPALPPVAVDRLYADPAGNIHHLHSDSTDLTLLDLHTINPLLNNQILTAMLAPNAVSSASNYIPSGFSTTSATPVPTALYINVGPGPANMAMYVALAILQWSNSVVAAANTFFIGWNGSSTTGAMAQHQAVAGYANITTLYSVLPNPGTAAYSAQLYMATNAGTLSVAASSISVIGINR